MTKPTQAQIRKLEKYGVDIDPELTREDAVEWIEEAELERLKEKEDFDSQVFDIRYDLLDHEKEFKRFLWRNHNMTKPKVATIKAAIKALNTEFPGWDHTSFSDVQTKAEYEVKQKIIVRREGLFFAKCKEIDPTLIQQASERNNSGCILLVLAAAILWIAYKIVLR